MKGCADSKEVLSQSDVQVAGLMTELSRGCSCPEPGYPLGNRANARGLALLGASHLDIKTLLY